MPNRKYKIIGVSNFDLENVSDVLIADNLNGYYGKKIEKFLIDSMDENDTYFPKLVDQDHKLYEFEP